MGKTGAGYIESDYILNNGSYKSITGVNIIDVGSSHAIPVAGTTWNPGGGKYDIEAYDVTVEGSSITVSSCPIPPPWSFVEVTADDGQNTGDPYYFASGSSQSTTEIDAGHITWDSTESYFTLANAGWYEFEMQGSIVVGNSPTDVTTSIVKTDGLGGIEVEKIDKLQRIRTNIDPHDIMIKWVGYCEANNYTCKLDGDNTVLMNKGSTFTCKRIN